MKTTLGLVFVLALVGCGTVQEGAGRPLKVLAVGNSFSFSTVGIDSHEEDGEKNTTRIM